MTEIECLLAAAQTLADESAASVRGVWLGDMNVASKADGSPLTEADLSVEALWRERIRRRFPSHAILGEEYGADPGASAYTWVLDPIDGTRQFGAGLLNHACLIAVCRDGEPVVGVIDLPLAAARYAAASNCSTRFNGRPVRSSGARSLAEARIALANHDSFTADTASSYARLRSAGNLRVFDAGSPAYGALARGLLDVCVNGPDLDAFDICALCPVVAGAGGAISDWSGGTLGLGSRGAIVASASPELHAAVLDRLHA